MTIKEARMKAHLTQQAMSDTLGIPKRTIEEWETNKRKPPTYVERLIVEKLNSLCNTKDKEITQCTDSM